MQNRNDLHMYVYITKRREKEKKKKKEKKITLITKCKLRTCFLHFLPFLPQSHLHSPSMTMVALTLIL